MMVPVVEVASLVSRTGPELGMGEGPFGLLGIGLVCEMPTCAIAPALPSTSSATARYFSIAFIIWLSQCIGGLFLELVWSRPPAGPKDSLSRPGLRQQAGADLRPVWRPSGVAGHAFVGSSGLRFDSGKILHARLQREPPGPSDSFDGAAGSPDAHRLRPRQRDGWPRVRGAEADRFAAAEPGDRAAE